jgi:hypothetical protein
MLKAKIVRLYAKGLEVVNIDVGEQGSLQDECVYFFRIKLPDTTGAKELNVYCWARREGKSGDVRDSRCVP